MSRRRCTIRLLHLFQIWDGSSPNHRTAETRRQWNPYHPSLILHNSWNHLRITTQRRPLCPPCVDSQSHSSSQSPTLSSVERLYPLGYCWSSIATRCDRRACGFTDSKETGRVVGLPAFRWQTFGVIRRTWMTRVYKWVTIGKPQSRRKWSSSALFSYITPY